MNLTASALTANLSSTATAPVSDKPAVSSDFETFLKMLTTQARYQDPLQPIDSSEYSAQLAQFSMVEQQVKSNDLLTALTAQLSGNGIGQVASWIGMEAKTNTSAHFAGTPISVAVAPTASSDASDLVVYDSANKEVQRSAISTASGPVIWAGVAGDGTPFPDGTYRFMVESKLDGDVIDISPAQTYSRIIEVRQAPEGPLLILKGGAEISAHLIEALREAG